MKHSKSFQRDIALLLLGVMLGVFGSMFGNILERYFSVYGIVYEICVTVLFFGTIHIFMNKFDL